MIDSVTYANQPLMPTFTTTSLHAPRYARTCPQNPSSTHEFRAICFAVSMVYRVERLDLTQPSRGRSRIAFARQVAMYLANVTFGHSLTMVGREFGRDRTTVAHACRLVEDARDDREIDRTLDLLEAIVRRLAQAAASPITVCRSSRSAPCRPGANLCSFLSVNR